MVGNAYFPRITNALNLAPQIMKTNAELIKWLRDNSSGVCRPSNEAADRLADALYVIRGILTDLPQNKDWLNPELERAAKLLISLDNA